MVILGLLVLAAAAYYAAPYLAASGSGAPPEPVRFREAVKTFDAFAARLGSAGEYSYCVVKTVAGRDASYSIKYSFTASGKDYAAEIERDGRKLRQIYKDGRYVFVDDTNMTYYPGFENIGPPDVHFTEALSGKPAGAGSEIVNGFERDYVRVYMDGTVYVYYFDSQGGIVRFYYVRDSNAITLDFCRFVFGRCPEGVSFDIPGAYGAANVKPMIVS